MGRLSASSRVCRMLWGPAVAVRKVTTRVVAEHFQQSIVPVSMSNWSWVSCSRPYRKRRSKRAEQKSAMVMIWKASL